MSRFTVARKAVSNGTKVKISIQDAAGKPVGSRTSVRDYHYAVIVKTRQDRALAQAKANLGYHRKTVAEYASALQGGAFAERWINFENNGRPYSAFHRDLHRQWLADGTVQKWVEGGKRAIADTEEFIARLESGPQPEYDVPFVLSFHHTRKNVPASVPEYVSLVEVLYVGPEVAA